MASETPAATSSAARYEPFSPYYLHPSEGTGSTISPVILTGDNYEDWRRMIRNNLRAKTKLGFLDGDITPPAATHQDFAQWGVVNSMLNAWIVNTLDESIRGRIRYSDNVKDLWDDLHEQFSMGNGPRILELKSQIAECKQHGKSVSKYYSELRRLQDDLAAIEKLPKCTCAAAPEYARIRNHAILHQFCMGLDATKFGNCVSSILMMDPLPALNIAYAKVVAEERKQIVSEGKSTPRTEAVGFSANAAVSGHANRSDKGSDKRVCSHCNKKGHTKDSCFGIYGYPEWYQERRAKSGARGGHGGQQPQPGRTSQAAPRGNTAASGFGFASHMAAASSSEVSTGSIDRAHFPSISDEHWSQLLQTVKSVNASSDKLSGPHFEEPDWSGGAI